MVAGVEEGRRRRMAAASMVAEAEEVVETEAEPPQPPVQPGVASLDERGTTVGSTPVASLAAAVRSGTTWRLRARELGNRQPRA